MKTYFLNLAGAFSQLINALLGGYRDNSLSVRTRHYLDAGVLDDSTPRSVRWLAWLINALTRNPEHVANQEEPYIPGREIIPLPTALLFLFVGCVITLVLTFIFILL